MARARSAPARRSSRQIDIAPRIRAARSELGLSLRDLAKRSGFSASFLSQVELGQASPSLASLDRIAGALGLDLPELLRASATGSGARPSLIHRRDESVVRSDWSRATLRLLLPPSKQQPVSILLIGLDPGGRSGRTPHARPGGTFAFCVAGGAELVTPSETLQIEQGDSVYYDATTSTMWRNPGSTRTELLVVSLPR